MANARASYHAARLSLQKLIGDVSEEDLFNRVTVATHVYLWTFTTPDACEAKEVLTRWSKYRKLSDKAGTPVKCFRVLEKHPKGHGYHIHFITVERLDVRKIRTLAERAGFGRIHVLRIPTSKAAYVIKYLVKALRKGCGRRLWACVGFKGVRASDVIIEDSFWDEVFSGYQDRRFPLAVRREQGLQRVMAKLFQRDPHEEKRTMQKDDKNLPTLLGRLNKGEAIVCAEYRSTRIDSINVSNKQNPSQKEPRIILRHGLEAGDSQLTCVEWTPPGTTAESIKMTLKKGQLCLVSIKRMETIKGVTEISGELVPLS